MTDNNRKRVPVDDEAEAELIPLWPTAGRMAFLGRSATYDAAAAGQIPVVRIGRLWRVPLRKWRRMLDEGGVK